VAHLAKRRLSANAVSRRTTLSAVAKSNVAVEWAESWLHISDVTGSILGPETGYPDKGLNLFPRFVQKNVGTSEFGTPTSCRDPALFSL
jgi:hypothetical protein